VRYNTVITNYLDECVQELDDFELELLLSQFSVNSLKTKHDSLSAGN